MDIKYMLYVLLLESILYLVAHALSCFECFATSHPRFCDSLTLCTTGENCYVQKVLTSSGNIQFNSGCMSTTRCRARRRRRRSTDITICEECCVGDYCNNKGCGVDTPHIQSGPYCFGCHFITDPSTCNKVEFCYPNEKCAITENLRLALSSSGPVYTQSCSRLSDCGLPNRRCCDTEFCNGNYTKLGHGSPDVTSTTTPLTTPVPPNPTLRLQCDKLIYEGYFFDTNSQMCLKLVKNTSALLSADEAERGCQQHGAHLASIRNNKELDAIYYEIFSKRANDTSYWIGAKAQTSGSYDFRWPDHTQIDFANWERPYRGQPDSPLAKDEHCVFMNYKDMYRWHDESCTAAKSGYICEIVGSSTSDKSTECRRHIFDGYRLFGDICIKLYTDTRGKTYTRSEAETACKREGGDLVTIDTKNKADEVIREIFKDHANATDYWIGAKANPNNPGIFLWPSGGQVSSYTNWGGLSLSYINRSQPDSLLHGAEDQRCIYMDYVHDYYWFDIDCNRRLSGYICQRHDKNDTELACRGLLSQNYWYDRYTDTCFVLRQNVTVTRSEAQTLCQSEGSTLLSVTSQSALNVVLYRIFSQRHNDTDYWLDGVYDYNNHGFVWQTTNQSFTFTNWYRVEPSDCVVMNYKNQYRWAPRPCSSKVHGYICRLDVP